MTEQETLLLNQFSAPAPLQPGAARAGQPEPSLFDFVFVMFRHKKLIVWVSLGAAALAALSISFWRPNYVSQATILPPQQGQSSMAMLASGALSGLASGNIGSSLGLKNPADLYIGILKSRTIADEIIAKFDLQQVYKSKRLSDARKVLSSKASFTNSKESLITIAVTDHDPQRATAMANAFIEALYKQNNRLAITGAAQKRLFFEQQLNQEKESLAKAEVDLKTTQQASGLVVPQGQAEMLIRSGAELRAKIASSEVQLQSMRGFETDENPQVQLLKREISAWQSQLAQIESNQKISPLEVSGAALPQASLEYARKLREVKYHEALFELIAKQYEVARIDEVKEPPLIQVVDSAVMPDRPTRPSLPVLYAGAVLFGLAIGCASPFAVKPVTELLAGFKLAAQAHAR